jgi:hypothetical protein
LTTGASSSPFPGAGVAPALKQLADDFITIDDATLRSLVRINEE